MIADLIGIHCGHYLVTGPASAPTWARTLLSTSSAGRRDYGQTKVTDGHLLPEDMLAENRDDIHAGAANLRKQIENVHIQVCHRW